MTDVSPRPEKQIEQLPPKLESAPEANAKLAGAKDASPGTLPAEPSSEHEKFRITMTSQDTGGMVEAKLNKARDAIPLPGSFSDKAYSKDIKPVEVSQLPDTPEIRGVNDFKGNTSADQLAHYESLKADLLRHEEMRPYIEQGHGPDTWDAWDQQKGIGQYSPGSHLRGYSDTYRAFYDKSDCIAVDEVKGKFVGVENGRHRIYLARELGIKQLPVFVLK
jgi:hypothetical protein